MTRRPRCRRPLPHAQALLLARIWSAPAGTRSRWAAACWVVELQSTCTPPACGMLPAIIAVPWRHYCCARAIFRRGNNQKRVAFFKAIPRHPI